MKELLQPTIEALRKLGGSASISDLYDQVVQDLRPSKEILDQLHTGHTRKTELEYRLDWARTRLKWAGLLDNSQRGVWSLTPKGRDLERVEANEIMKTAPARRSRAAAGNVEAQHEEAADPEEEWRDKVLEIVQQIPPSSFERLCQRLLREAGFVKVSVRGGSGDEGIDGQGYMRIGGLISLPVYFQCKRYRGSVGTKIVRDFRGAMEGRSQHGLLITTGHFTAEARTEAAREGARLVDLIDGYQLADKLKELGLGIESAARIVVKADWFQTV